jgi:cyclophilin family peptidyl-prolyl cis-trans isomerase
MNDPNENDAALAAMNALFKLNKNEALSVLDIAAGSPDNLIRRRVHQMHNDDAYKGRELSPILKNIDRTDLVRVRRYSGKGTRLGQVLNNEADYRRAAARRNGSVKAVLTTKKGTLTIDLLPDDAPLTVDNFVRLANSKYFDGLEVHRVVPNFVMQDGDPRGDGTGGPGWTIRCEVNMVPYGRGTVGMALAGKDTGGSQWFVTHAPQPHLDGGYTVFGRVSERDMAVVDRIVQGDKILTVRIFGR